MLGNSGSLRIIDNYMNQINCYKYGHMTAILHTLGVVRAIIVQMYMYTMYVIFFGQNIQCHWFSGILMYIELTDLYRQCVL